MQSAELEMQALEWSSQQRTEQAMLTEAGEVVSELNAEQLRNQELQASVDALKWEVLAVQSELASRTAKSDSEHARVQAQAAANANAVASTMTELEEAKVQLDVMAAELARRQAEHDFETSQIDQLQQTLRTANLEALSVKQANQQLELSLADLRITCTALRAQCDEKAHLFQESAKRADFHAIEFESSKATVSDLQCRLESLARQYDDEKTFSTDLRQTVDVQRKELQRLGADLAAKQESLRAVGADRERDVHTLNTELENLRSQFELHQAEMLSFRVLTEQFKAAEGQLISLKEERDDLQDKLIAATALSSTAQIELDTLIDKSVILQQERDELRSVNDHLSRQLEIAAMREQRAAQELTSSKTQLDAAASALATKDKILHDVQLKTRLTDAQCHELQLTSSNELISLRSKLQEANACLKENNRKAEQQLNQLKDSETQRYQLQQLLNETTSSLDKLRDSHSKTMDALRAEHDKSKAALQQALQAEKAMMDRQFAALQGSSAERILDLESALTVARGSIEELATQRANDIAAAESKYSFSLDVAQATNTPRARPLRATLSLMEAEMELLRLQLQECEQRLVARNDEYQQVQHQLLVSEDKCTRLTDEVSALTSKSLLHASTQASEETQLTAAQEQIAALRLQIISVDNQSEHLRKDKAELRQQLQQVTQHLLTQKEEAEGERQLYARTTQALRQEAQSLESAKALLCNQVTDLHNDRNVFSSACNDMKARQEALQQELSRKQRDLSLCMRERAAAHVLADELRGRVNTLNDQIGTLHQQWVNGREEVLSLKAQDSASKDSTYALQQRLAEISEIASKATGLASELSVSRMQLGAAVSGLPVNTHVVAFSLLWLAATRPACLATGVGPEITANRSLGRRGQTSPYSRYCVPG
jgi:chromosome segregation ATPase